MNPFVQAMEEKFRKDTIEGLSAYARESGNLVLADGRAKDKAAAELAVTMDRAHVAACWAIREPGDPIKGDRVDRLAKEVMLSVTRRAAVNDVLGEAMLTYQDQEEEDAERPTPGDVGEFKSSNSNPEVLPGIRRVDEPLPQPSETMSSDGLLTAGSNGSGASASLERRQPATRETEDEHHAECEETGQALRGVVPLSIVAGFALREFQHMDKVNADRYKAPANN